MYTRPPHTPVGEVGCICCGRFKWYLMHGICRVEMLTPAMISRKVLSTGGQSASTPAHPRTAPPLSSVLVILKVIIRRDRPLVYSHFFQIIDFKCVTKPMSFCGQYQQFVSGTQKYYLAR